SRRLHTRFSRDWSSDVCSSDLAPRRVAAVAPTPSRLTKQPRVILDLGGQQLHLFEVAGDIRKLSRMGAHTGSHIPIQAQRQTQRSEERRVGKQSRGPVASGSSS